MYKRNCFVFVYLLQYGKMYHEIDDGRKKLLAVEPSLTVEHEKNCIYSTPFVYLLNAMIYIEFTLNAMIFRH